MSGEAFGIAKIVRDDDELERVEEAERRRLATVEAERHHGSAGAHLLLHQRALGMAVEAGIEHGANALAPLEPPRQGQRAGAFPLDPERPGLQQIGRAPWRERVGQYG